jgi:Zn-finger nucleic acid-binding protein
MYVKCPCCHVIMNRKQFAAGSGVIIDVCRKDGVFFDAGKLPAVVQFVMSGGLERAHEIEIERKREQIRSELMSARLEANRAAMSTSEYGHGRDHVLGGILASLWY